MHLNCSAARTREEPLLTYSITFAQKSCRVLSLARNSRTWFSLPKRSACACDFRSPAVVSFANRYVHCAVCCQVAEEDEEEEEEGEGGEDGEYDEDDEEDEDSKFNPPTRSACRV